MPYLQKKALESPVLRFYVMEAHSPNIGIKMP